MARIDTCPNCGHQREIVVIMRKMKGKQPARRKWLHSVAPTAPSSWIGSLIHRVIRDRPLLQQASNGDEPDYVEWYWVTPLTKRVLREKLDGIKPSEIKLMVEALDDNDWKYSRNALRKQGRFTDTRAFDIGQLLNQEGLRTVDGQNQSHLAPHFLGYLYTIFLETHPSNKEPEA